MPIADHPPMATRLLSCPSCGKDIQISLPVAALPPDLLDALAHWYARLEQALRLRLDYHLHAGISLALTATGTLLLASWDNSPSADDEAILALFTDPAQAIDLAGRGKATEFQQRLLRPVKKGSGKQLTTVQVCYRAWAAQASLAQINASSLPVERAAGAADITVANATHWVAKDPAAKLLGGGNGVLSPPTVRNMRLRVIKNAADDQVARFARGIPPIVAEKGTAEARDEAKWFLHHLAARNGHAFAALTNAV